jgi:hypothetical protein
MEGFIIKYCESHYEKTIYPKCLELVYNLLKKVSYIKMILKMVLLFGGTVNYFEKILIVITFQKYHWKMSKNIMIKPLILV